MKHEPGELGSLDLGEIGASEVKHERGELEARIWTRSAPSKVKHERRELGSPDLDEIGALGGEA